MGIIRRACKVAGVGRQTHYDWMEASAEYREAFAAAKEDGQSSVGVWAGGHHGITSHHPPPRVGVVIGSPGLNREICPLRQPPLPTTREHGVPRTAAQADRRGGRFGRQRDEVEPAHWADFHIDAARRAKKCGRGSCERRSCRVVTESVHPHGDGGSPANLPVAAVRPPAVGELAPPAEREGAIG